ncbi:hypothetical protein ZEAMMB73_Zm00001d025594 [Zea mays]|uniref:Uncharacterized protein n=1 Tax=Zea mays TaxID=4577 RepID=A0A1D6J816_MAIZE|nr:hypothetical protein ZEAMMB73_Zm00001d025594 [Zea mays]
MFSMVGKKFNEAVRKNEGIVGDVWQHLFQKASDVSNIPKGLSLLTRIVEGTNCCDAIPPRPLGVGEKPKRGFGSAMLKFMRHVGSGSCRNLKVYFLDFY